MECYFSTFLSNRASTPNGQHNAKGGLIGEQLFPNIIYVFDVTICFSF